MPLTFRRLAAPLALLALLAGCSKDEKSDPPKPPAISLSVTSLTFDATMAGDPAPAAKTVAIGNSGEGTLAKPTVTVDFGGGATGWLTAEITGDAAPYTLTVTPSTAVAAGDHTATIEIASAGASNTPATVTVAFSVTTNPLPVIAVSASALTFTAEAGDPDPAPQTVAVTNGGGGTLTDPTVDAIDYGAGPADWLSVSVDGATDVVTVTALTGALARGHYEATLYVTAFDAADGTTPAYNSPVAIPVAFDVTDPTLAVSPASLAFSTTAGVSPAAKTVTVTNSADGTLAVPTVSDDRTWLSATVSGTAAPFTVTVSVDAAGLGVATYTGSVTISSANASNSPLTVPVTLTVSAAAVRTVSCYKPAYSTCQLITSDDAVWLSYFEDSCTSDGGSLGACPATTLKPCNDVFGEPGNDVWYYAPQYDADKAAVYCAFLGGTWNGPTSGGSPSLQSFACNVPAEFLCTDLSGQMTSGTRDGWEALCQDFGGSVIGTCSTSSRIGTCTYTQDVVTFRERYYTGSGATQATDCSGVGKVWTPG